MDEVVSQPCYGFTTTIGLQNDVAGGNSVKMAGVASLPPIVRVGDTERWDSVEPQSLCVTLTFDQDRIPSASGLIQAREAIE